MMSIQSTNPNQTHNSTRLEYKLLVKGHFSRGLPIGIHCNTI